jgi:hypothetical protein
MSILALIGESPEGIAMKGGPFVSTLIRCDCWKNVVLVAGLRLFPELKALFAHRAWITAYPSVTLQ